MTNQQVWNIPIGPTLLNQSKSRMSWQDEIALQVSYARFHFLYLSPHGLVADGQRSADCTQIGRVVQDTALALVAWTPGGF